MRSKKPPETFVRSPLTNNCLMLKRISPIPVAVPTTYRCLTLVQVFNRSLDATLKPSIKKSGKPIDREGVSHCVKVLRLESYEDALDNLELHRTQAQGELLRHQPGLREDYMLRYMLDVESKNSASLLDLSHFASPFGYTLKTAAGFSGEKRTVVVDLVETFNCLLGLRVKHVDARVTLNSFVVSVTPHKQVVWWGGGMSEQDFEDHHIFFREAERLTHIKKI